MAGLPGQSQFESRHERKIFRFRSNSVICERAVEVIIYRRHGIECRFSDLFVQVAGYTSESAARFTLVFPSDSATANNYLNRHRSDRDIQREGIGGCGGVICVACVIDAAHVDSREKAGDCEVEHAGGAD